MIIEAIFTPIFALLRIITTRLPDLSDLGRYSNMEGEFASFLNLLSIGFYIFPLTLFLAIITNVLF
jgi:hypothetical protein